MAGLESEIDPWPPFFVYFLIQDWPSGHHEVATICGSWIIRNIKEWMERYSRQVAKGKSRSDHSMNAWRLTYLSFRKLQFFFLFSWVGHDCPKDTTKWQQNAGHGPQEMKKELWKVWPKGRKGESRSDQISSAFRLTHLPE